MAKIRIYDVAKALNVSNATVTRALNGLPKVSSEKRKLIIETAAKMGYTTNQAAASLSRRQIEIAVVLYGSIPEFYNEIARGIEDGFNSLKDFNIKKDTFILNTQNKGDADLISLIEMIGNKTYAGVLIHSIHDNEKIQASVEKLCNNGKIVYTINSDISIHSKHYCIMSNAEVAGKMAAEMLDWSVSNRKICHFLGGKDTQVLNILKNAFVSEAKERGLKIVARYYDDDSIETTHAHVSAMLKDFKDIGGIYVSSAISPTVCNRLLELGGNKHIRIVTSDLLHETRNHIKRGVVQATIYQNPYNQGFVGFENLFRIISEGSKHENQILIMPLIITKSNVDFY